MRTWVDTTGQHRTEAAFVQFKNGQVTLKKADGKTIKLALASVSAADQAYGRSRGGR